MVVEGAAAGNDISIWVSPNFQIKQLVTCCNSQTLSKGEKKLHENAQFPDKNHPDKKHPMQDTLLSPVPHVHRNVYILVIVGQKLPFPLLHVNTANRVSASSPWLEFSERSFFSNLQLHLCVYQRPKSTF